MGMQKILTELSRHIMILQLLNDEKECIRHIESVKA
jgi:hypothetical protein